MYVHFIQNKTKQNKRKQKQRKKTKTKQNKNELQLIAIDSSPLEVHNLGVIFDENTNMSKHITTYVTVFIHDAVFIADVVIDWYQLTLRPSLDLDLTSVSHSCLWSSTSLANKLLAAVASCRLTDKEGLENIKLGGNLNCGGLPREYACLK